MPVSTKAGRLRVGRVCEVGRSYLLTIVVHQRQAVFADWWVGRLVVEEMRVVQERGWGISWAWVIMPDHIHWLLELQEKPLDEVMCWFKSRSSLRVNRQRGGQGRLWQKGYHDRAVRQHEDLKSIARYVIQNPVRAGLVKRVHDYPLWDACWL